MTAISTVYIVQSKFTAFWHSLPVLSYTHGAKGVDQHHTNCRLFHTPMGEGCIQHHANCRLFHTPIREGCIQHHTNCRLFRTPMWQMVYSTSHRLPVISYTHGAKGLFNITPIADYFYTHGGEGCIQHHTNCRLFRTPMGWGVYSTSHRLDRVTIGSSLAGTSDLGT